MTIYYKTPFVDKIVLKLIKLGSIVGISGIIFGVVFQSIPISVFGLYGLIQSIILYKRIPKNEDVEVYSLRETKKCEKCDGIGKTEITYQAHEGYYRSMNGDPPIYEKCSNCDGKTYLVHSNIDTNCKNCKGKGIIKTDMMILTCECVIINCEKESKIFYRL